MLTVLLLSSIAVLGSTQGFSESSPISHVELPLGTGEISHVELPLDMGAGTLTSRSPLVDSY